MGTQLPTWEQNFQILYAAKNKDFDFQVILHWDFLKPCDTVTVTGCSGAVYLSLDVFQMLKKQKIVLDPSSRI